ncbi:MAG: hypothetical protein K2L22_07240 [Muribaculaceae bacterium]|nr:hypothetical protein [Muribaculaceae bacterium]
MKKFFTFSFALALCNVAVADDVKVLTCGDGTPGIDEPQLMAEAISPNGKYVCGAIELGNGVFVANTETSEVKWVIPEEIDDDGAELRGIDNFGMAVGYSGMFGISWQFDKEDVTYLEGPKGSRGIIGEALSNDGSILVGSILASQSQAAYSKDGGVSFSCLPMPPEEDVLKVLKQVPEAYAAKRVSGDGKVIVGYIGSFTIPCVWVMNENGEYVPDLFPVKFLKLSDDDLENEERPLSGISAMYLALSNNGRYLCLVGLIPKGDEKYVDVPIVYDIQTKSLTVYSDPQEIDLGNEGLYPSAISNEGTFIGTIGMPVFGSSGCFIMKAGASQAELFVDAFPAFNERYGESDYLGYNVCTGISADGRYITGYTYYAEDYNDLSTPAYYESYIIDRGEVGTEAVDALTSGQKYPEAVYSIDGRSLRGMTKGINIIRNSDGSVRKVLKK